MLLKKKNAVIYGAGGAVGGAVARTFAREGAKVSALKPLITARLLLFFTSGTPPRTGKDRLVRELQSYISVRQ